MFDLWDVNIICINKVIRIRDPDFRMNLTFTPGGFLRKKKLVKVGNGFLRPSGNNKKGLVKAHVHY